MHICGADMEAELVAVLTTAAVIVKYFVFCACVLHISKFNAKQVSKVESKENNSRTRSSAAVVWRPERESHGFVTSAFLKSFG